MPFDRNRLPDPLEYYWDKIEKLGNKPTLWTQGLCPFHAEHTPSFSINKETGAFKCHGCGESGGDVLAFHRKYYNLDFVEAAKELGAWR